MVYKVSDFSDVNEDLNKGFYEIINRNIKENKQSIIYLTNDTITLSYRGVSVDLVDDILKVYRDGELRSIIDVNYIVAVSTR